MTFIEHFVDKYCQSRGYPETSVDVKLETTTNRYTITFTWGDDVHRLYGIHPTLTCTALTAIQLTLDDLHAV